MATGGRFLARLLANNTTGCTAPTGAPMRKCGFCKSRLTFISGWEKTAEERAGKPTQADKFECSGCGRRFFHGYEESFSGDEEWWNIWTDDRWTPLPENDWPT